MLLAGTEGNCRPQRNLRALKEIAGHCEIIGKNGMRGCRSLPKRGNGSRKQQPIFRRPAGQGGPAAKEKRGINMKKRLIKKYARTIARIGLNIQRGQGVLINAEPECEDFAVLVAEECYRAGAGKVVVDFLSNKLTRLDYKYQKLSTLQRVSVWQEEKAKEEANQNPAKLLISSSDPMALKGIDVEKAQKVTRARRAVFKKYRDELDGKQQWCIAACPSKAWAKTVFPGVSTAAAVEKLWEAILASVYVDEENDPEEIWEERREDFERRCRRLNSLDLRELHYTSAKGTDLTVGLIKGAVFEGGGATSLIGIDFVPNLPTEEIFTTPMRGVCEGVVYSTKPLSYSGNIIDNFSITFKDGKAVSWQAEQGEDLLGSIITLDEGSSMLGEVAIVPETSPLGQTGILFLNTLFDENASCHLALGRGISSSILDYEDKTMEELCEMGINDSLTHVDFMIGDETLCITGTTGSGKKVKLLENGLWAF